MQVLHWITGDQDDKLSKVLANNLGHCARLPALLVACGFAADTFIFVPHAGYSELSKRLSRIEEAMQHAVKRHKTGFTDTPFDLAAGELVHQASACMSMC